MKLCVTLSVTFHAKIAKPLTTTFFMSSSTLVIIV